MNISDNHKWLLDFCGYYNGEEENIRDAVINVVGTYHPADR